MMNNLLFREIQISKLAVILLRSFITRAGGFFFCWKGFTEDTLSVFHHSSHPSNPIYADSLVSCSVVASFSSVCGILALCAFSQVVTLVIQAVAISVVYIYAVGRVHYLPVHLHSCSTFPFPCISHGVPSVSASPGIILPLVEMLEVSIINQCDLALRKFKFLSCLPPKQSARHVVG